MSGFDFGSGGLPVPADIQAVDGNLVLIRSDGSMRILCPVPRPGDSGPAGRGVSHTDIVGGNLVVTYTDGTVLTAGHVLGEPGTAGAAGRGIAAIEIVSGRLTVTFSDNTVSDLGVIQGPVGAAGAVGRGIASSVLTGGHLVITYTDGTSSDLGAVTGAAGTAGRGVTGSSISNGHLILSFSDGTTQDVGQVVGASATPGPYAVIDLGNYEITASNSSFNLAAIMPAGTTQILVECVGAGASGFSGRVDNTNGIYVPGHGGAPGAVRRRLIRVADIANPASVNAQVGAGGARAQTNQYSSTSNEGGLTSFAGMLQALGGRGGYHLTNSDLPYPWQLLPPSDVPLGRQGYANGPLNGSGNYGDPSSYPAGMGAHAAPSMGPGAGGAGRNEASNSTGTGGWAGMGRPDTARRGGYFDSGAGVPRDGFDAPNVYGYGSGGCGSGIYPGAAGIASGGKGMFPGGGGGGGSGYSGTQAGSSAFGGPGGNGAIRLFFQKVA
ncbi:glycine rich protein [Methylorubrum extorquens]